MSWDLNRQAKVFLISLSVPWLIVLVAVTVISVLAVLACLGFTIWPLRGPAE